VGVRGSRRVLAVSAPGLCVCTAACDLRGTLTARRRQVTKGTYDLEANLALLRFYQYAPATAKIPVVCKVSCSRVHVCCRSCRAGRRPRACACLPPGVRGGATLSVVPRQAVHACVCRWACGFTRTPGCC
jgi:hypothetical protein